MAKMKTVRKIYDNYGKLVSIETVCYRDLYRVDVDQNGVPHLTKIGVEETSEVQELYKF